MLEKKGLSSTRTKDTLDFGYISFKTFTLIKYTFLVSFSFYRVFIKDSKIRGKSIPTFEMRIKHEL